MQEHVVQKGTVQKYSVQKMLHRQYCIGKGFTEIVVQANVVQKKIQKVWYTNMVQENVVQNI